MDGGAWLCRVAVVDLMADISNLNLVHWMCGNCSQWRGRGEVESFLCSLLAEMLSLKPWGGSTAAGGGGVVDGAGYLRKLCNGRGVAVDGAG